MGRGESIFVKIAPRLLLGGSSSTDVLKGRLYKIECCPRPKGGDTSPRDWLFILSRTCASRVLLRPRLYWRGVPVAFLSNTLRQRPYDPEFYSNPRRQANGLYQDIPGLLWASTRDRGSRLIHLANSEPAP